MYEDSRSIHVQKNRRHIRRVNQSTEIDITCGIVGSHIQQDQGDITAKKTYSEIAPHVPAGLMEEARRAAVRQMIILSAKGGDRAEEAKPAAP